MNSMSVWHQVAFVDWGDHVKRMYGSCFLLRSDFKSHEYSIPAAFQPQLALVTPK